MTNVNEFMIERSGVRSIVRSKGKRCHEYQYIVMSMLSRVSDISVTVLIT